MAMDNPKVLNVLVIENEEYWAQKVKGLAEACDVGRVEIARDGKQAEELLDQGGFNCATIDIELGDTKDPRRGLSILSNPNFRNVFKIVLTDYAEYKQDALTRGTRRFLSKEDIKATPERLEEALRDAAWFFLEQLDIYYQSDVMADLVRETAEAARFPYTILLRGESGAGKEKMAQLIHKVSGRLGPFKSVNCGALNDEEGLNTFFGIAPGAYPKVHPRPGDFELHNKGTIFFDEIGEMPHEVQVQLLRVLEHPEELQRRGATKPVTINGEPVDVRCIFATDRDIEASGQFHNALLHRIRAIRLEVPPLSKRKEDIPQLAWFFLDKHVRAGNSKRSADYDTDALRCLTETDWKNENVRGLSNAILQALIKASVEDKYSRSVLIKRKHLDTVLQKRPLPGNIAINITAPNGKIATVEEVELAYIKQRLIEAREAGSFNLTRICKELDIATNTIWDKARKHGFDYLLQHKK